MHRGRLPVLLPMDKRPLLDGPRTPSWLLISSQMDRRLSISPSHTKWLPFSEAHMCNSQEDISGRHNSVFHVVTCRLFLRSLFLLLLYLRYLCSFQFEITRFPNSGSASESAVNRERNKSELTAPSYIRAGSTTVINNKILVYMRAVFTSIL